MNPTINTSLQTNVQTGSSPSPSRASSNRAAANQAAPEGLNTAPSLLSYGQSSKQREAGSIARMVAAQLVEDAKRESLEIDLTKVKKILEELIDNSILGEIIRLEPQDLAYIVQALFFSPANSSSDCLIQKIYKDEALHELIPLFEKGLDNLIFNITIDSRNGLPSLPEGSKLDLNAILDALCEHLETVKNIKQCSTEVIGYLQLYCLVSAYYEAPVLDKDFAGYSKTRIAKLEKLIGYLGPLYVKDCALLNRLCIRSAANLLNLCKESAPHVLKIKQDFACWLMTSFNVGEGESHLLILDFMKDVFQKSKLKTGFHEKGIDFDKEFLNDPIFVSYILRADCKLPQNLDTLTFLETPIARVPLLQKLESLGLKPEKIQKPHPILELALELNDPDLLRHLIVEYKFNPYYISDTTGYSVWEIFYLNKLTGIYHPSPEEEEKMAEIIYQHVHLAHKERYGSSRSNLYVKAIALSDANSGRPFRPTADNINTSNDYGETPLIFAAKFGLDTQHLLSIKELDLSIKDHAGKTALDYAKENNNKPLAALIEERKRGITTAKLIETLGASGKKDNYQRLIAFLHKKGNDGLSLIEKAFQSQNALIIEAIEGHLPAISFNFGEYASTAEGKKVQPLNSEYVLQYLKTCFTKNPPEALTKLRFYTYYYYSIKACTELTDEALNEAVHGLIGLIPDVREVDALSQDVIGGLINLFAKASKEAQAPKKEADKYQLENIARQAYRNVAHFLVSPVHIKNQSHSSFIVNFLNPLSIRAIHSQEEVFETTLNLKKDFLNSLPFFSNILEFSKQNFSGDRSDTVAIVKKLQDLGLNHDIFNADPVLIFHLLLKSGEFSLLKYLILKAGFNPFSCYSERGSSWSCAAYCRDLKLLSQKAAAPKVSEEFHNGWKNEIEPVLLKRYLDLPPHSPTNPRVDLIAQGYIPATPDNINLKNKWDETPLIFAAKYGYDLESLLEIQGIDIQAKDQYKKTALAYAKDNQDLGSQSAIDNYTKKQAQTNQVLSTVNQIYQNIVAKAPKPTNKKLSKRQLAQLKAEQDKLKKQEQAKEKEQKRNAAKKNKPVNTPIAARNTQKPTPAPITITIPELIKQPTDNLVYQEPTKEPSHLQKAKEQMAQVNKKEDAKKKKSLFGRVVSGAKELKSNIATAMNVAKNPSEMGAKILKQAVQRLATSKTVSTRVEAENKALIGYPDLLELLDLAQAQDSGFEVASNIQKILEAMDTALNAHYKNPNIAFSLKDIETALKWFYPDMTVTQHGSHRTYHFPGMQAITIATHKDNEIFKKALQAVQNRIREALLKKLGIKSYDVSEPALSPSPTDSSPSESKDESSEEEGLDDTFKGSGSSQD
jgi:ankyrin repeat protein